MTVLEPLYHWASTDQRSTIYSYGITRDGVGPESKKFSCLSHCGPTPEKALTLMAGLDEANCLDLYRVYLTEADTVVVSVNGGRVAEVVLCSNIPASRLRYIGSRLIIKECEHGNRYAANASGI